jgi:hypothetical protein
MQSEEHLMVDPSALIPWITPIITTVGMYIKTQGVHKTADKVAEVIEEKAAEEMGSKGQKAFVLLRSRFSAKADEKAKRALANVEQDPEDEDYQQKLVKETARLASADPLFAQELKVLGENVAIAQSGSVTIDNKASNYGVQGVVNAPINIHNR